MDRTDDGRYIVTGGRRWRAADPQLPEELTVALLSALGRARAAVRNTRGEERARAREQVQLAKEGLGERGDPWWELTVAERKERARTRLDALSRADGLDSRISDSGDDQE